MTGTGGDVVERLLHAGGELLVDELRKILFEQFRDRQRRERRAQLRSRFDDVARGPESCR